MQFYATAEPAQWLFAPKVPSSPQPGFCRGRHWKTQQSALASVDPASGVNSVEYLGGCDFTSRKKRFLLNEAAGRAD